MCGQKTNIGNVEKQSGTPLVSEVGPAKKRKDARTRKNNTRRMPVSMAGRGGSLVPMYSIQYMSQNPIRAEQDMISRSRDSKALKEARRKNNVGESKVWWNQVAPRWLTRDAEAHPARYLYVVSHNRMR